MRYPAVELLSGLLWMAALVHFGVTAQAAMCIVFFYVLLLLAFIDLDTMRLPNSARRSARPRGAGGAGDHPGHRHPGGAADAAGNGHTSPSRSCSRSLEPSCPPGSCAIIAIIYAKLRGAQGFGMGDIKLLLVIGLFLGPYGLLVLAFGSLFGSVYGLAAARRSQEGVRHKFPFGPFLALGAVLVTLFGVPLVTWYVALVAS